MGSKEANTPTEILKYFIVKPLRFGQLKVLQIGDVIMLRGRNHVMHEIKLKAAYGATIVQTFDSFKK